MQSIQGGSVAKALWQASCFSSEKRLCTHIDHFEQSDKEADERDDEWDDVQVDKQVDKQADEQADEHHWVMLGKRRAHRGQCITIGIEYTTMHFM